MKTCSLSLGELVDTKRDNYRQGGKCFLFGNGSFVIQIIAQIIIVSENFLKKKKRQSAEKLHFAQ